MVLKNSKKFSQQMETEKKILEGGDFLEKLHKIENAKWEKGTLLIWFF